MRVIFIIVDFFVIGKCECDECLILEIVGDDDEEEMDDKGIKNEKLKVIVGVVKFSLIGFFNVGLIWSDFEWVCKMMFFLIVIKGV